MDEAINNSNITLEELKHKIKKELNLDKPDSILLCTITDKNINFYLKNEKIKNYSLIE